jgi:hypothetical protein
MAGYGLIRRRSCAIHTICLLFREFHSYHQVLDQSSRLSGKPSVRDLPRHATERYSRTDPSGCGSPFGFSDEATTRCWNLQYWWFPNVCFCSNLPIRNGLLD